MMHDVVIVTAPGGPAGTMMSALPFLLMVGMTSVAIQQGMISLYITQDSFGRAANISGDHALGVFLSIKFTRLKLKTRLLKLSPSRQSRKVAGLPSYFCIFDDSFIK